MLEAFTATIDEQRRIGNTVMITNLEQKFGLPEEWTAERVVDLVWTLTGPEVADRLVRALRWTLDAYENWLTTAMHTQLAQREATGTATDDPAAARTARPGSEQGVNRRQP
jgi:hypothetical protein